MNWLDKFIVSERGQWDHPGKPTAVPTKDGRITMKGVPYPVFAMDETGYGGMIYPGGNYQFKGNMVYEIPMGYGGDISIPDLSRPNWLDKAQKGQQVKYYDNLEEFRIANRNYNDSLEVYNSPKTSYDRETEIRDAISNNNFQKANDLLAKPFPSYDAFRRLIKLNKTQPKPLSGYPIYLGSNPSNPLVAKFKKPTQQPVYKEKPKEYIPTKTVKLEREPVELVMPQSDRTLDNYNNTLQVLRSIQQEDRDKQAPRVVPAPDFKHGGWLDKYQGNLRSSQTVLRESPPANLPWINQQGQVTPFLEDEPRPKSLEDTIDDILDNPQQKAMTLNRRINNDNLRHSAASMNTTESLGSSLGAAILAQGLGAAHEISNLPKRIQDTKTDDVGYYDNIYHNVIESGEDMFNNAVGSMVGMIPFVPTRAKESLLVYLSNNNMLPDGKSMPEGNEYVPKKKYGGWLEKYQDGKQVERRDPNQLFFESPTESDTYQTQYSQPEVTVTPNWTEAELERNKLRDKYIADDKKAFRHWYDKLGYDKDNVNKRANQFAYNKLAKQYLKGDKENLTPEQRKFIEKSEYANRLQPSVGSRFVEGVTNPGFNLETLSNLAAPLEYPTNLVRGAVKGEFTDALKGQTPSPYFVSSDLAGTSPTEAAMMSGLIDFGVDAGLGALDVYGANMVSPLFKGATKGITSTYNPSEDDIIRGLLKNTQRDEIERMGRIKPVDMSPSQYPYSTSYPTLSKRDQLDLDSFTRNKWSNPGLFWKRYNMREHGLDYDRPIPIFNDPSMPTDFMSTAAAKGNMYGENQVLVQRSRLLNPDVKAKFFENQAPAVEGRSSILQKMPKDYGNRITPGNYEDFVKTVHGSTDYDLASSTGKQPYNLGIGNYGKPGMVYSDAPLNNLGKDIINAHEKNHGIFAGTLSKEMSRDLLKPFGTNRAIPNYADKNQADEVLARMGQFKNAVGIGDNQTFTLGHLNLIRKNYADQFLDNGITEMLSKLKPGSSEERQFLKNMNKYAFGIAAPTAIGAAALQKEKNGGWLDNY